MKRAGTVEVFSFCVFDFEAREMRLTRYKASRDVIVTAFGGEVVEGTGQDVSPAELDEHGRWRLVATGWGALP